MSLIVTVLLGIIFVAFRLRGHVVHIRAISLLPPTLHGITYNYHSATTAKVASIESVKLTLRFPLPRNPRIAIVTVKECTYRQGKEHTISIKTSTLTLWFLPVFFRFTAGTILDLKLDGFTVDVTNSKGEPWWLKAIRQNVTETIFQGETVRLHDMKSKVWLYQPITPSIAASDLDIEGKNLGEGNGEDVKAEDRYHTDDGGDDLLDDTAVKFRAAFGEGSDQTESRVRIHAIHWLIHNHRNERMYMFSELNAELRRPWGAPPYPAAVDTPDIADKMQSPAGSLVLRATDAKWTKLPRIQVEKNYFKTCTSGQLALSILSMPRYMLRLIRDPLSAVDIEISSTEMTFREFRIRDAELFSHGVGAARKQYRGMSASSKQAISDWCWDIFVEGMKRAFSDD